jgi:hypothetical protein
MVHGRSDRVFWWGDSETDTWAGLESALVDTIPRSCGGRCMIRADLGSEGPDRLQNYKLIDHPCHPQDYFYEARIFGVSDGST